MKKVTLTCEQWQEVLDQIVEGGVTNSSFVPVLRERLEDCDEGEEIEFGLTPADAALVLEAATDLGFLSDGQEGDE